MKGKSMLSAFDKSVKDFFEKNVKDSLVKETLLSFNKDIKAKLINEIKKIVYTEVRDYINIKLGEKVVESIADVQTKRIEELDQKILLLTDNLSERIELLELNSQGIV